MGRTYLEIDSDTDGLAGVPTRRDAVTISSAFASTQQDVMATLNHSSFASDDQYQHLKPLSINEYTEERAGHCVMGVISASALSNFYSAFFKIQFIVSVFQDFLVHLSLISGKIGKHQHFLINLNLIALN